MFLPNARSQSELALWNAWGALHAPQASHSATHAEISTRAKGAVKLPTFVTDVDAETKEIFVDGTNGTIAETA